VDDLVERCGRRLVRDLAGSRRPMAATAVESHELADVGAVGRVEDYSARRP